MPGEALSSRELAQDKEAAQRGGCFSVLLFPPFSAVLFGALLFVGLVHFPIFHLGMPEQASQSNYPRLATLFTPQVMRWESEILAWAAQHDLDPNLVATVMQIESCGNPKALSPAGAQGLFQVMPYHFATGEDETSPDTNALRGLNYLRRSLDHFDGNASLALAGYNGGINGASRPSNEWAQETRDYQYWGENIYADALAGKTNSPTLNEWLAAGGASLCAQAEQHQAAPQSAAQNLAAQNLAHVP
jgi:hypothetical protein